MSFKNKKRIYRGHQCLAVAMVMKRRWMLIIALLVFLQTSGSRTAVGDPPHSVVQAFVPLQPPLKKRLLIKKASVSEESSASSSSSSTKTTATTVTTTKPAAPAPTSRRRMSWSDFRFAPNGVCIEPERFVVLEQDNNKNDSSSQQRPKSFTLRNVPGTGDCMFQAVALASFCSVGLGANDVLLRAITKELRNLTATLLEQQAEEANDGKNNKNNQLVIRSASNTVSTAALLASATEQEGFASTKDYLAMLRKEGVDGGLYGGGPELTILCNLLRRPISIYELVEDEEESSDDDDDDDRASGTTAEATTTATTTTKMPGDGADNRSSGTYCTIECKGTFGGGIFHDPLQEVPNSAVLSMSQHNLLPGAYSWHLHILVLKTSPTEKHACVLLPQQE